jgi:hypothetical protein
MVSLAIVLIVPTVVGNGDEIQSLWDAIKLSILMDTK